MTEDDIHLLAKETAGQHWFDHAHLMRFAKAAIAQARRDALEEAAQKCLSWGEARKPDRGGDALKNCAAAIRDMAAKGAQP
jgi:hypothetical protein